MSLTLNQILKRLQTLAESHKQINTFFLGAFDEFMDSPDLTYPACFCELDKNHSVGTDNKLNVLNFNLYFFDLMDTAQNSQKNEYEIKSDMLELAKDFYAMLNFSDYQFDWVIGESCPITISDYQLSDLCAGVGLSVQIGIPYSSNRCQVPATDVTFETDTTIMEKIIDNYITKIVTGGTSLTLPELQGKEIMMLFLGNNQLRPVTTAPGPNEYRYTQNGLFEFGTELQVDTNYPQYLQILNRPL